MSTAAAASRQEQQYVAIPEHIDGGSLWPNLDGELYYCLPTSTPMYVSDVAVHFSNEYKTPYDKVGSILTVPGVDVEESAKLIAAGKAKIIGAAEVRKQLRIPGCMVKAYALQQYESQPVEEPSVVWSLPFW